MEVQINQKFVESNTTFRAGNSSIMITPPLDGDYWLLRVPVSDNQAVVGFPKFGTIGVGFQHEEDWNTNLPYSCEAEKIYGHIRHNKGDDSISDQSVIEAIEAIQSAVKELGLIE